MLIAEEDAVTPQLLDLLCSTRRAYHQCNMHVTPGLMMFGVASDGGGYYVANRHKG